MMCNTSDPAIARVIFFLSDIGKSRYGSSGAAGAQVFSGTGSIDVESQFKVKRNADCNGDPFQLHAPVGAPDVSPGL
jgi:hypothetical protein